MSQQQSEHPPPPHRPDGSEHRIFESHLKIWRQCPARFRYAYLTQPDEAPPLPPGYGLRLGKAAHKALELLWQWAKRNKQRVDASDPQLRTRATAMAKQACRDSDIGGDSEDMIIARVHTYLDGINQVSGPDTIAIERYYRLIPTHPPGIHVPLVGIFDRVDKVSGKGQPPHLDIIDYKLGSPTTRSDRDIRGNLQMILYTFAAAELWPWARRISTSLHYLGSGDKPTHTRSRSTIKSLAEKMLPDLQHEALAELEGPWPTRPGPHCTSCQFRHLCPEFPGLTREEGERLIAKEDAFQQRKQHARGKQLPQAALFTGDDGSETNAAS